MAKVFFLFALFCTSFSLSSTVSSQERDCSKLKSTGNPEYPPYLFKDPANPDMLIGANTLIMQQVADKLGVEIEVSNMGPWSRAQKEVREGRFDLLAGAFFTVPRAQSMDYIHPAFLTTKSVVWMNKDKPFDYQQRENLIGRKGVTVIHNSFGENFDRFAKQNLTVSSVVSLQQAFDMLVLGRVDYLLYEKSPAEAYSSSWRVNDKVMSADANISQEGLFLTLSHRSACNTGELRGKLTKVIREIVESGQAQQALRDGLSLWQTLNPGTDK